MAILGANDSLKHILRKSQNGEVDPSDWSVIHAGALLTRLGARVEFLKEGRSRTADIRAWWNSDPVDAEVKTAAVKEQQVELRRIMATLREVIGIGSTPWHPLVHLGEVPVDDIQSDIIDSVLKIGPGDRAGVPNVWELYAAPLDQAQVLVDRSRLETLRPAWWNGGPSLFDIGLSSSENPEDVRRILIAGKLRFVSYLNQVREKAERPQGDPRYSFLVMLDQGSGQAMPVRHQRWQSELATCYPSGRTSPVLYAFINYPMPSVNSVGI